MKKKKKQVKDEVKIERLGVNKNGEEIYRKFTSKDKFIIGTMVDNKFTPK